MNRLSPLIVRRPPAAAYAAPAPVAAPAPIETDGPAVSDDVRLFATNFLGGLAFFGTYLA
jgi:hypothetical protein